MAQLLLSPLDRRIDELGAEARIQTEDDARLYVQAISDRLGLEKKNVRELSALKLRLAHEEYLSVKNPSKRIPEARVADAFNSLMHEWKMPAWTRVQNAREMHAFRVVMSAIANPISASRLPDGNIAPTCRPVEAIYLIWLLNLQMGISPALREKLRAPGWLEGVPHTIEVSGPPVLRADARDPSGAKRTLEYLNRRSMYFSRQSTEKATKRIARILNILSVE